VFPSITNQLTASLLPFNGPFRDYPDEPVPGR